MQNRTVLHVTGFAPDLRARDLAWEFERYGRLIRCDIPALKMPTSIPFAFIEFRREDDAEEAYYDMHGRMVDGRRIAVQWAKRPPSSAWRHEGSGNDRRDPPRDDRRPPPPPSRRDDYDRDHRSNGGNRDRDSRRSYDDRHGRDSRRSLSPRRDDRSGRRDDDRARREPSPSDRPREDREAKESSANGASGDAEKSPEKDEPIDEDSRDP